MTEDMKQKFAKIIAYMIMTGLVMIALLILILIGMGILSALGTLMSLLF